MRLHESAEDYLERILMLTQKNGKVKSIDIAEDMSFSKASVSVAMKKLKELNYITIDNGYILLTSEGLKIATDVYDRHNIISKALINLGVPRDIALEDACKIEHDLSKESYNALKKYIEKNNLI